jgi:YidC/Oxa1 family membrane protein insertase
MDKRSLSFLVIISVAYFGVHTIFGMWQDDQKTKPASVEQVQTIAAPVMQSRPIQTNSVQPDASETFYVLQNDYQQLVFSTVGGALAEINLPLQNQDPKSLVKEIDIDREIRKQSPKNAQFPLHAYYQVENGNTEFKEKPTQGGFYPLLRRSLLNQDGSLRSYVDPSYYALAIIGDNTTNYKVTNFTENAIQFQGSSKGRTITKTFTIPQVRSGPYCLELTIDITGDASELLLSSGVPDVELVGGAYTPQLKYQVKVVGGAEVDEISLPKAGMVQNFEVNPFWISNCNGFLGLILDPLTPMPNGYSVQKIDGSSLPTRLSLIDAAYQLYPAANYPGYATLLPLPSGSSTLRIFAGPYDQSLLKKLDALYEEPSQNYNPEYNLAISIQGWFSFISQPFSKFLFLLMQLFYAITHSWAVSIVLLTIALRAMMYPLNNWSIKSTVKMQEIAPRIKEIQEKNKKDPRKAQLETMSLYKEMGVNPFSGCLPMLLQMPFLIGMFYMLKSSFPLRGAPFILGWIDDLAAPDVLFSWGQPIWMIGNEFHLLPILTGLVMFIQGKMTQKLPKDPSKLTEAEKQQKMMGTMMSVVLTIMFYSFPSGLNIYFMISTLLGIIQQKFLMNKFKSKPVKNGKIR